MHDGAEGLAERPRQQKEVPRSRVSRTDRSVVRSLSSSAGVLVSGLGGVVVAVLLAVC